MRFFLVLLVLLAVVTAVCIGSPSKRQLWGARALLALDALTLGKIPKTDIYLPAKVWNREGSSSWTCYAGVWIEDRLYYRALGVSMGIPPSGYDVSDLSPGIPAAAFGGCENCKRSWKWVQHHATMYTASSGTFPLCERCWRELATPEARLPYYKALFDQNMTYKIPDYETKWPLIEAAVREGK